MEVNWGIHGAVGENCKEQPPLARWGILGLAPPPPASCQPPRREGGGVGKCLGSNPTEAFTHEVVRLQLSGKGKKGLGCLPRDPTWDPPTHPPGSSDGGITFLKGWDYCPEKEARTHRSPSVSSLSPPYEPPSPGERAVAAKSTSAKSRLGDDKWKAILIKLGIGESKGGAYR